MQILSSVRHNFSSRVRLTRYWVPSLFLLFLSLASISGCLSDPITGPQILYRGILRPQGISRRDTLIAGTPSLVVRWAASSSDTQLNFRGYEVALYIADSGTGNSIGSDTVRVPSPYRGSILYDSAIVPKGSQAYMSRTFIFPTSSAKPLQIGQQYMAGVWGLRYSNPASPDSLFRSIDSAGITFRYDPRPVFHPTVVQAVASGPVNVNIKWVLPPSDTQSNLLGYTVYYRRAFPPADSGRIGATVGPHQDSATVTVPAGINGANTPPLEAKYLFYVAAVRADSLIDSSSVGTNGITTDTVTWSGAEQFNQYTNADPDSSAKGFLGLPPGYGVFIGQLNSTYAMIPASNDSTNSPVNVAVRISGNQVTLQSGTGPGSGTQFAASGEVASDIAQSYYSAPVPAYNQPTFALPTTITGAGYIVHAQFAGGTHARIFFRAQMNGSFIAPNGGVEVKASFQPLPTLPYD